MILRFHRSFEKRYKKLYPALQMKVDATIRIFAKDPHAKRLRNHALAGSLSGKRAISVTGNVRIIYETEDKHVTVLFLDVGTHAHVYE